MEKSRNFEQIVKRYTPRIFKMIYNMIGNYETQRISHRMSLLKL